MNISGRPPAGFVIFVVALICLAAFTTGVVTGLSVEELLKPIYYVSSAPVESFDRNLLDPEKLHAIASANPCAGETDWGLPPTLADCYEMAHDQVEKAAKEKDHIEAYEMVIAAYRMLIACHERYEGGE